MGPRESQGKGSSKQDLVKISSKIDLKTSPTQQKVPMFKNDVSVDNMVVEIEPNDLFPRKAGGVKPEYPWKVGGTAKRGGGGTWKEKRQSDGKERITSEGESPCKKVSKDILQIVYWSPYLLVILKHFTCFLSLTTPLLTYPTGEGADKWRT